jgi:hypothetical protein
MADYLVEKHFLTVFKIFGLGPFTQDKSGLYKVSKKSTIYFSIILIYIFLLQNCTFYEYAKGIQDFDIVFLQIFQFVDYFGFSLSCFFSAIILFRRRHEFCDILNKINKLNQGLKNFDGTLLTSKSFFCIPLFVLLLFVNLLRTLHVIFSRPEQSIVFLIILFAFSTLSQIMLMDLFFAFLVLNIRSLFKNLNIIAAKVLNNKKIENKKLGSSENIFINQIIFIKKYHKEINVTANHINEEYSAINVMSFAYTSTVLIYSPFVSRHWDETERILSAIFWISFFLLKMLLVIYLCTEATTEVVLKIVCS